MCVDRYVTWYTFYCKSTQHGEINPAWRFNLKFSLFTSPSVSDLRLNCDPVHRRSLSPNVLWTGLAKLSRPNLILPLEHHTIGFYPIMLYFDVSFLEKGSPVKPAYAIRCHNATGQTGMSG